MPYIPHTIQDTKAQLDLIGEDTVESLFDEIPRKLRASNFKDIPSGMYERELLKHAEALCHKNQNGICFIGAGSYDHYIPAAVWEIASRGEFLTAYTPYQAEASQGTLQLLYEFQTMISELTGMEVANASLYDGATALAEAILMAARLKREHKHHSVLIPRSLHPHYRHTLETIVRNQHIEVIEVPFDLDKGITSLEALTHFETQNITALVIPQPNFFGCLEPVDELTDWASERNLLTIACVNPISLGLLKPPGQWGKEGVDIVCGEGQPLGCPMASGGPYFGFFSTRLSHVRQLPGRLIGRTLDQAGKEGFTLTLQAREQHIRRGKATSNICTNQGLLVTAATIYMSLLGAEGLKQTAYASFEHTHSLSKALCEIPGIDQTFQTAYFHETVLSFKRPVEPILKSLIQRGILGGLALSDYYPELPNTLLICATEQRTNEEILFYQQQLSELLLERENSCSS